VTRDLEKFCIFERTGWQHFLKKVLETFISNEHTRKIELNHIDFKNTKNKIKLHHECSICNNYVLGGGGGGPGGEW